MNVIIVISAILLIVWLVLRNINKHKSQDDFSNNAREGTRLAEKETRNKWYGLASSLSESDDEYALISNKENVFKPPATADYSSYEEPLINEERINKFIEWAKNKNKGGLKLLDLIDENLEFEMPVLSGNFSLVLKTDGAYFCEDFNVWGFEINRFKSTNPIRLDYENWVKVLTNPNSFDWLDYIDNIDCYDDDIGSGDFSYFLKDCTEFVPKTGDAIDYFDYAEAFDLSLIDCELVSEISYKDEIFLINKEEFTFLKKEKEHLITLLMASYKPSLLKRILKEL